VYELKAPGYETQEQTETQEQPEMTQDEWLNELFGPDLGPVCNTLIEVILFFNIQ
jgi:hypothetical protein